jgi:hypothetical protein
MNDLGGSNELAVVAIDKEAISVHRASPNRAALPRRIILRRQTVDKGAAPAGRRIGQISGLKPHDGKDPRGWLSYAGAMNQRRPGHPGRNWPGWKALATKEEIRGRWFVPEFGKGAMLGGLRWRWRLDKAAETHVHKSGSECVRPAYARAMKEILARRIIEMAQDGTTDQQELVAGATRFIATNYRLKTISPDIPVRPGTVLQVDADSA